MSFYSALTDEQLREILSYRGLKVSGRREDLIQRLETGINVGSSYEKPAYRTLPQSVFCGSAGGASPRSYPVDTESRCRAALSYARHAPNPEGIRQCALEKAQQHPDWRCGVTYGRATSPPRSPLSPPRSPRSASPEDLKFRPGRNYSYDYDKMDFSK